MDSQKAQYDAGQISGQTREKTNNLIEKANKNTQHVKDNVQQGGQQMLAKAHGAAEGAKDATGINK
ncbi:putative stress-induced protein KIN1/KIN2 [Helianthus anomalus]